MERKESEVKFREMMDSYAIFYRKAADVMACPYCHKTLFKRERQVDYQIVVGNEFALVECKQGEDGWQWDDYGGGIRPIQRQIMNDWSTRGVRSYIFLLLGPGRAPKEKHGYLIPWVRWLDLERMYTHIGSKSIPWQENERLISKQTNAQVSLFDYRLIWSNGHFAIPEGHDFAISFPYYNKLQALGYWRNDADRS